MSTTNPLKQIMDIRREEVPQALLMSAYFFLVIATFWVLRPLKTGLFVQFYDQTNFLFLGTGFNAAQAQMIAKVGNMFVAFVAATIFVYLARSFERQQLTYIFAGFSVVCLLVFSVLVATPGGGTVWAFYWFGDLYTTLMVATFFAFLNDSVEPAAAKRLYGVIVLGGVAGGAFGALILAGWIDSLSLGGWLLVCAATTFAVAIVASMAGRRFGAPGVTTPEVAKIEEPVTGNPATVGARLVFSSKYLLAIVAIVGLYEMVSTIMDFQFSSTISYYLDGDAITQQFASVFAITNSVALFVQLFLTSFVMTRFGVGAALLFLPVAALLGSAGFLFAPVLLIGGLLNTVDGGFAYSINQSAKEVLYTPTSKAEKYQAKAFIDMFVQRFAKAVAVGLSLAITTMFSGFESIRWLSLLTIVILAVWVKVVRYAGREFNRQTGELPGGDQAGLSSGSNIGAGAAP